MYVVFAMVGLAWAAINVNSLPMVVEMCRGSDIGRFTGYYYTFSMVAQVVTPIAAGSLMRAIDYRVLFPYAAIFSALSFVTMCLSPPWRRKGGGKEGAGSIRGHGCGISARNVESLWITKAAAGKTRRLFEWGNNRIGEAPKKTHAEEV